MTLIFCKDNSDFHYIIYDYDPEFLVPYIDRAETRLKLKKIFEETGQVTERVCTDSQAPRAKSCPVAQLCFLANSAAREPFKRTVINVDSIQRNAFVIHEDQAS